MPSEAISGRRRELGILQGLLDSRRAEFLALHGRRRVGKTFLVREFFGPRADLFQVTGRFNGTLRDHLRIFHEAMVRAFTQAVDEEPPTSWHEAFLRLREALARRRSKKKIVLFFDELPWLATRRSGCLDELEFFWNDWASSQPKIILVVCGSAASWILSRIVNAKGGLHNRVTRTMRLLPFDLVETKEYLTQRRCRMTDRQVLELYMALGGVPYYLSLVDRGESVAQTLDRLFFDPAGPLREEFGRLFTSLFGDDPSYEHVVRALAKSRQGLPRDVLLREAGLSSGGGSKRILEALEQSGFILTTIPFGRTSRDRLFRLVDELSLFHLRWLADGRRKGRGTWTKLRGKPTWRAWSGLAFESLCLVHVDAIRRGLGISGIETSESAWMLRGDDAREGAQIDLLIDRADDVISVCELKFTEQPFAVTRSYAKSLEHKLAAFRAATGTQKATQLVLVASSGLTPTRWSEEIVDEVVTGEALFR